MLQVNKIRENRQLYIDLLKIKNIDATDFFTSLISLDDERKLTQQKTDQLLSQGNKIAREIGELYKAGRLEEADVLKKESINIKELSKKLQKQQSELENDIQNLLIQIPNIPHVSVPFGKSEVDNETIKEVGDIPTLMDGAMPHWELTSKYGLIDFELGNKITGSGFPVYTNIGAKLQRALINFFLDKNINAGYTEYLPPHVVNQQSGFGTGQLPKFEQDLYKIPSEKDLYLIPTAEVFDLFDSCYLIYLSYICDSI